MTVVDLDSFTAAMDIMKGAQGKTTVLNVASHLFPGGGWIHSLSKTQVGIYHDIIHLVLRGSTLLFIHPLRDFERVVLPMADPRPRLSCWDLFSWGCHLQR